MNDLTNLERLSTLQLAALEMIVYKLDRVATLLQKSNSLQERLASQFPAMFLGNSPSREVPATARW